MAVPVARSAQAFVRAWLLLSVASHNGWAGRRVAWLVARGSGYARFLPFFTGTSTALPFFTGRSRSRIWLGAEPPLARSSTKRA